MSVGLASAGAPPIIPRPTGEKKGKGSISTESDYKTVCELTVTKGVTFQLAKIVVSCDKDVMVKVRWDGSDVSIEYLIPLKTPFTDWFPWDWNPMVGDGTKKVDLQAKYPTGGEAGTVFCELSGEEV